MGSNYHKLLIRNIKREWVSCQLSPLLSPRLLSNNTVTNRWRMHCGKNGLTFDPIENGLVAALNKGAENALWEEWRENGLTPLRLG